MPEGDTIFRAAQTLHRFLSGRVATRFESVYPALNRVNDDRPIVGRTIEGVSSRGKHLVMTFSGDLVLRTHMRMNGSWHIYPAGAPWKRPAREMRVLVGTHDAVAVGFNIPVAEFLSARELARHVELRALGPDLLGSPSTGSAGNGVDAGEIVRRLRARPSDAIADALLNQRVVAGIGNVFKSEILFAAAVYPFTRVDALPDEQLLRVIDVAAAQLRANVMTQGQTLSRVVGRRTTRSLDPAAKLWVYGRGGKPCRRCGTPVAARASGVDARLTFWCPRCQPERRSAR